MKPGNLFKKEFELNNSFPHHLLCKSCEKKPGNIHKLPANCISDSII